MHSPESFGLGFFLLSLALLIGLARILGEFARHVHQPAIIGELLAGVLLGPTVFGTLAPEWQSILFPHEGPNAVALDGIGSLAIVLFLLVAGMEVDLSTVWKQGRAAFKVGFLGMMLPFAVGLAGGGLLPEAFGAEPGANPVIFALFLATAMSISALPVIAKTLMDLDLYRTDLGVVIVSAAILNDLIGWTIFAFILGMTGAGAGDLSIPITLTLTVLFVGLTLTLGRWLVHRALPVLQAYTHYPGGVLGFAMTCALCGAAMMEFAGVHAIFGAFIVGIAIGDSKHLQERTRTMIDEFISFVFAPVFFASIGLKVNFIADFDPGLVLLVLMIACFGKIWGAVLGAKWGGFAQPDAWAIGFAMNARGAMEIILGMLALELGIIGRHLFVALVVMAIVTSMLSGPLIRRTLSRPKGHQLESLLSSKLFIPNLQAETSLEAIRELAELAAHQLRIDAGIIEKIAWDREQIAATGIGNGVAIPHARMPDLAEPKVVVGVSDAGVPFDAPDGQPAHVIFLLLTPKADTIAQLEISANISRLFRDPRLVERIERTQNFTEFLAVLKFESKRLSLAAG